MIDKIRIWKRKRVCYDRNMRKLVCMNKGKILAAILYGLPCVFFMIAYLLMTMSGEDVAQANMSLEKNSIFDVIGWVYSYIPRIGEFITWPVATILSYQTAFGLDLLVRLIDVVAVVLVIYLLSFMILGRKPRLRLLDVGIFNSVFMLIVLIPQFISPLFGNPFLSGFSFINNYATMSLIAILFVLPFIAGFLKIDSELRIIKNPFIIFVLGFLFAISTELLPVSFIAVGVLYVLFERLIKHETIKFHKWQVVGVVGILVGVAFFYMGGGLSSRTDYTYAETYNYIAPSLILSAPRYFIMTYLDHLIVNMRYVLPIIGFSVLAMVTYKVKKNRNNIHTIRLLALTIVFSVIYVLGSSLIMLDDAIAVRLLLPCYLLLIVGVGLYVRDYYSSIINTSRWRLVVVISMVVISSVVMVDMVIGKVIYARRTSAQIAEVKGMIDDSTEKICLTKLWASEEAGPVYSPIFSFTQEPLFEPWNVKAIYGYEIDWAELGDEAKCEQTK